MTHLQILGQLRSKLMQLHPFLYQREDILKLPRAMFLMKSCFFVLFHLHNTVLRVQVVNLLQLPLEAHAIDVTAHLESEAVAFFPDTQRA